MTTEDDRQAYECSHWFRHRMAAKGLTGYSEGTLLVDEWIGRPPPEALAAIERGEHGLTPWCPVLNPAIRERFPL